MIRTPNVRVIDYEGNQLGILTIKEALAKAAEDTLDLVEVSPNADPPVCRILDYGKFKYEQSKKDREAKSKRKSQELKEVKFRLKIDTHDYDTKVRIIKRLLEHGDKVKVTIMFRGRELSYTTQGLKILARVAKDMNEIAVVEHKPKKEGRNMHMIIAPRPGGKHTETREEATQPDNEKGAGFDAEDEEQELS